MGDDVTIYDPAVDYLFVSVAPLLTKDFLVDPVATGGTTTLEFSIVNTSPISTITDIAFIDEFTTFLPFPISANLPAAGFCGAGATAALVSLGTDRHAPFCDGWEPGPCRFTWRFINLFYRSRYPH